MRVHKDDCLESKHRSFIAASKADRYGLCPPVSVKVWLDKQREGMAGRVTRSRSGTSAGATAARGSILA